MPTESQDIDGVNVNEDVVLPAGDAGGERQLGRGGGAAAAAAGAERAPLRAHAAHRRLTPAAAPQPQTLALLILHPLARSWLLPITETGADR